MKNIQGRQWKKKKNDELHPNFTSHKNFCGRKSTRPHSASLSLYLSIFRSFFQPNSSAFIVSSRMTWQSNDCVCDDESALRSLLSTSEQTREEQFILTQHKEYTETKSAVEKEFVIEERVLLSTGKVKLMNLQFSSQIKGTTNITNSVTNSKQTCVLDSLVFLLIPFLPHVLSLLFPDTICYNGWNV